ncbi:ubiquitin carboxyl-terminal hydrolase 23 isoform X1 [Rhodamnia argentea]|uniref:Ubiquitin carboxyl-terminal hydrolase n=1 Tax=Rhodamnia argentea TaxID=178133 RepID=A0A8B8QI02_9MYRT|nr:ubiquitin carboxyl-terminal hydrolase 23 isoform X1 [Rhodamnia argentea]
MAVSEPQHKDLLAPFAPYGSSSSPSLFQRRVEFHPARKQFNGFGSGGGDFKIETLNPSVSQSGVKLGASGSGQASGKKVDGLELVESWLDPELSFGASVQRIGAGLENLGNTCFLNSVLQCLTYTEPLAAYLQSGKHQNSCRINGFCALCAIQKHVSRALKSTGRILAPKDLVSNLRCISRNFRNARQEDAHEYMVNLLESMHKCCLPSGVPTESPSAYDKSLVHKIFGGRLRSQVKCMQCFYCSNTFDPFLDLSLEIAKADSVVKALKHFTAAEQLDGGERQYRCQRCKQKVRALKQLTVHKAPYVLTIHLKRFHDPTQKINRSVQFDTALDLKPFVSCPYEGDLKYTLYGVLVHHGWSTHSGHYYCYVRTSTNMWYSLDDNQVHQVSESKVLQQKAYMLFYVRNRSNTSARKLAAVAHKDMKEIVGGPRAPFISNQSTKGPVKLDQMKSGINSATSSTTFIVKDAVNISSSSKISLKESSVKENFGPARAENPVKKDSILDSVAKDSSSKVSVEGLAHTKDNVASVSPMGISSNDNLENAPLSAAVHEISKCNGGNSKKELTASIPESPASNASLTTAARKLLKDGLSQKINAVSNLGVTTANSCHDSADKSFEEVGPERSPEKSICDKSRNIPCESIAVAMSDKTDKIGQGFKSDEAVNFSVASATSDELSLVKTLDSKPHKKFKKHLKYRFASLHLGSNILLRASLRPRKKRKKNKHDRLAAKNLNGKQLNRDLIASDFGPSTSEATEVVSVSSKRRGSKSCSKKRVSNTCSRMTTCSNGDSLVGAMDGAFRDRTTQSDAVLATDSSLKKSISSHSSANLGNSREYESLEDSKRDTMQNGLMSMLTRGLEETLVAHWDGIEFSPSPTMESNGAENTSIGYVLDEWDEEYDRGKRKKVRQAKFDFGGPNYFQKIASEKINMKKTKLDKASSGSLPFRI